MAKTTAETMRGKQIEANINDLLESYKTTNDAAKQTAIFNELVAYYNELDEMEYTILILPLLPVIMSPS